MTQKNLDEKHNLRPLTRGELKTLRKEKISLTKIDKMDPDKAEEIIDRILETVLEDKADELANLEALEVFERIIALTYGDENSEKNLPRPGPRSKKVKPRKSKKK